MAQLSTYSILRVLFALGLCVVYRGPAKSQTITASELIAPVGTPYHLDAIVDLFPWDTLQGSGVLWDYAWTEVDTTSDIAYTAIPLTDAPDLAAYPDADRVVRSISGTNNDYVIDRFFDLFTDHMTELGSVGPVLSYVYDTPETIYPFPMELGDTVRGDYCFWSDGFGIQYHFCGENYVTYDAMGTLTLPYGTYSDVKHVTRWSSSFETTEPATDSSYSVRQQWFVPGIAYPVLEVTLFIDGNGQFWPSGWLMDAGAITGSLPSEGAAVWSVHPNPASDMITVQRTTLGPAHLELRAMDGRVVRSATIGEGTTQESLSLEGIAEGAYLVRMHEGGRSTAQRLLKVSGH